MAYNPICLYIPDGTYTYEDGGAGGTFTESGTTFGTGYWAGTQAVVFDSTDTLSATGAPVPTDFAQADGWMAFRFRRDSDTGDLQTMVHIGHGSGGTDNRLLAMVFTDDTIRAGHRVDGGATNNITFGTATVGTEYFLYMDWSGTDHRARLDGGTIQTSTRDTPDATTASVLRLGFASVTNSPAWYLSGAISAFAMGTGNLTEGEIDALQTATDPWTWNLLDPPANTAPTVDAGADATITAGDTLSRTVSFTDPDADTWSATADYGEGAGAVAATVDQGAKTVALSNLYETAGNYTVTVVVSDGTTTGQDTFAVTVDEAPAEPVSGSYIAGTVAGTDASAPTVTFTS